MGLFKTIADWFRPIIRAFRNFLKQLFSGATEIILAELKDLAINAVQKMYDTDLSNEEKRNKAFKEIGDAAKARGLNVKDHLINLAIEMALAAIKKGIES